MLRIIESTSGGQAKSYFSTADYYTEGQELIGKWRGQGAERLGLSGNIEQSSWDALCDNIDPRTGKTLTLRQKENRRVGYDFNFHVPKSYSLLWSLTQDERLLDAFRESVNETMNDIESEMKTRVRSGGKNEDRETGNMVWGEFVHFTSRPVDGIPDPHLHLHAYVFNTTFDEDERRWKAGQFGDLKRDAPYFEGMFHVRLGHKLAELGIAVDRSRTGWEIAGASRDLVEKFSRRTQLIEDLARKNGITDPSVKSELGAKTRKRKEKDLPLDSLREVWKSWLTPEDREWLERTKETIGSERIVEEPQTAQEAVRNASDHCFERKSVVPERILLAESLKRAVGKGTVQGVREAFRDEKFLIRTRNGRRMATTEAVIAEERAMIGFARNGRGTRPGLGTGKHEFTRTYLNDGQRKAVEHVLHSTDRVIIIRGAAGVGKTSMMQEATEGIERHGKKVFAFAPSARASRGVLREKGFAEADTLARLLKDEKLQQNIRGQVIWIDEAGMVGTRTMAQAFSLAEKLDARIVLSGDRYQHGSVERGAALRLLEEEAGLIPAEIKEIMRQKDDYKRAVSALSEGRVGEGFQRLDDMGWVREVATAERYKALANDYVDAIAAGESALVVSPTHLEAERCTNEIRSGLKRAGTLGQNERRFLTLESTNLTEAERADAVNFSAGDVLVFHQNAKGFKKGERLTVGVGPVPTSEAARFQSFHPAYIDLAAGDVVRVTQNGKTEQGKRISNGDLLKVTGFDNGGNIVTDRGTVGKDWGFLDYGYVVTSHASQGTDVKRVFIGQSAASFPASSMEQFYVSVSRGQKQATIYTDNKSDLLEAVRHSDERLSATELLNSVMVAGRGGMERYPEPVRTPRPEPSRREHENERVTYER